MRFTILLCLWSLAARAGSADEELARAHYQTGSVYYEQRRIADALKEFHEAYRRSRRPALLYNIAVCEDKLGHRQAAVDAYRGFLAAEPDAPDRAVVAQRIDELAAPILIAAPVPKGPAPRPRRWLWALAAVGGALVTGAVVAGAVVGTRANSPRTLPDLIAP